MDSFEPKSCCCITFLSDFGTRDTYVSQMKGVALSIHPGIPLIDLTHEIPPQQILQGAYIWNDALDAFDPSAIHVAIVDPGVGSDRPLIAAEIGSFRVVCPDNGLLSVLLQRASVRRAVRLDNPRWWRSQVSSTFHGRDILTPVAAAWSRGIDLTELGFPLNTPPVTLPLAIPLQTPTSLVGCIVDIDRFGNLITNIAATSLPSAGHSWKIEMGAFPIFGLSKCYADAIEGDPLALIGSSGRLEIAIRAGSAADEFQAVRGQKIIIRWSAGAGG